MRRRTGAERMRTPARLLLALALVLVVLSGRGAANSIRRSSSFVVPTMGSAHSLTLTTYVTDAADLHYAAVLAGHAPLEAAAIKSAAEQVADGILAATGDSNANDAPPRSPRSDGVVQARTVAVHRAQKLERLLDGLQANTSYDVYFVAEVPNSNGVFGQVLSVMGTTTNPTAPSMLASAVSAANGSATAAVLNLTLSSPGIVHVAFVPSIASDEQDALTVDDVVTQNHRGLAAVFLTETRFGWDSLSTSSTIEDLTPATEYDVVFVSEALGHGSVFSELYREHRAVQTHAAAPDVADVVCVATKASSSSVDVSLRLQFAAEDVRRATALTTDRYQYHVHYEVSTETVNGTSSNSQRGVLPIEKFTDVDQLRGGADNAAHTYSIKGLDPGVEYDVSFRVETIGSHGVFGEPRHSDKCRTHARAPRITKAHAQPMNGTVSALQVEVELEAPGNVHYVLTSHPGASALRKSFQQTSSIEELVRMVENSTDGQVLRTGVIETSERDWSDAVAKSFVIDGLEDSSQYSIVLMPETIGSFGVYGKAFNTVLEATTHEHASEISIVSVRPTQGSITSVDVQVAMTKPADLLIACWRSHQEEAHCDEVPRDDLQQISQSPQASEFVYRFGNLTEDTRYEIFLYSESHLRNGVRSLGTDRRTVRTHRQAPELLDSEAQAVDARVDALRLHIETSEPGKLYYAVALNPTAEGGDSDDASSEAAALSAEAIISEAGLRDQVIVQPPTSHDRAPRHSTHDTRQHLAPASVNPTSWNIVKRGHAQIRGRSLDVLIDELQSNSTYSVHIVMETAFFSDDDDSNSSSGVYGSPKHVNATTHDVAPFIVKAAAGAMANRTDSIIVTVNVSRPGIIHYLLTDTDFADPTTIKLGRDGTDGQPHTLRGRFVIDYNDMAFEIKNGTNDTQPMEPMVFANNFTVGNLHEATTYHLSLTTETPGSNGVFGEFPAPILVTTHDAPPQFVPDSLVVGPTAGFSTSISIQFRLDRLGEVHYAIFFKGLVRDRTTDAFEIQEQRRMEEQDLAAQAHAKALAEKDNTTKIAEFVKTPRWPPPSSAYDLSLLTPRAIKDASLEELREGVWENGTISVSRDDIAKLKVAEKTIDKLPPNGIFDVCLVPETAASDGIFASLSCHRVVTHADYSNQSVAFDEVHLTPVAGAKDAVHVQLFVSKKLEVSDHATIEDASLSHLARVAGRIPYFVLVDGQEGRSEFSHNSVASSSRRHDRTASPFITAVPGRGNVVASGILDAITFENDSFVTIERTLTGLLDNHRYFFYFAYETADSHGVFTTTNPHKHRPNETASHHSEVPAIEVVTFEQAPRIKRFAAVPTYGNTSSITVKMDVACASEEMVILHVLVVNKDCPVLSTSILYPGANDVGTAETRGQQDVDSCEYPLLYRRLVVNMTETSGRPQRHDRHSRHSHDPKSHSIEEDILGDGVLQANTTYHVMMATETYNSSGVISDKFVIAPVTTAPRAPHFNTLRVQPRKGSTTELLIIVELDHPGEVHYMLGKSGNPELNVTSPYNVSAKSLPGQRDSKFHDYARDVVRSRRTVKLADGTQTHVEVVDYLVAGTSYDVYVVAETAGDYGVYGEVLSFPGVSTFATPPMLLAHTAYPTPQRTDSLSVGFRVEEGIPCLVHISIITSSPWGLTSRVASGSDTFGNRLALEDRFVGRSSIAIDGHRSTGDDDWHEVNVSVPQPGTNYTVFLVTETRDSDGVFGTVASHHDVRSHREPPVPLNVSVRPTDARVDAVTVDIGLNHDEGGHIHFAVLRHRQRFSRSSITRVGRVDVVGSNASTFIIDGLQGQTTYDVYLRLETLESGGVVGDWTPFPVTATTHGLPAEVLESVECEVVPTCDDIGRQPCSHVANVCGECLDGFDGLAGSSNVPCRPFESEQARPSIKISGVRINPRRCRSLSIEVESSTNSLQKALNQETRTEASEERVGVELTVEEPSTVSVDDPSSCPLGAKLSASGQCECDSGYHFDALETSCVPSYENPLLAQSMALHYASRAM